MRTCLVPSSLMVAAVGALSVMWSGPVEAGTIRHDRADSLYTGLANDPNIEAFKAVGTYSGGGLFGSLTLIHPSWALTAAHVADGESSLGTIRIAGQTRTAAEIIAPTGTGPYPGWTDGSFPTFDISLVRLSSPITAVQPAKIYTKFQELGKIVTMVGYGRTGDGTTGSTKTSGTKRAGQNVIDELFTMSNGATGLRWDFDDPAGTPTSAPNRMGSDVPLDLEYQIAPGDSGGGSFIFDDGEWVLAGVHSASYDYFTYPGTSDSHTYGDVTLATRVAAYQDFIYSHIPSLAVVPEPASAVMLAVFGSLLVRRRRAA